MNKTQKKLLFLLAMLMPATTMPCVFTITNDSNNRVVYVTTNQNMAASVSEKTLESTARTGEDVIKLNNSGHGKTGKTLKSMVFYVYTKNAQKQTFDRAYKVAINYCSMEPGANVLTIQEIERGVIPADFKGDRYTVDNYKKNTHTFGGKASQGLSPEKVHACGGESKPAQNSAKAAVVTHTHGEVSSNQQVIERERPEQFLSNPEVFPDTLP